MRAALNLLFPPRALDADVPVQTVGLTAEAWSRVTFIEDPVCDGCGAPYEFAQQIRCTACQARPRVFARARAACVYDEYSRDLILQLKHADRTDHARLFQRWLSRAGAGLLNTAQAIVPVPLARGRLFQRRYNQSAEVARPLARERGIAFLPDALSRVGETTQAGKSAAGRKRNVAGAFHASSPLQGQRVLLIDDVMTTGATAEACARALLAAGASAVDVLVIARVKDAANLIRSKVF
jgi:ComF family protein